MAKILVIEDDPLILENLLELLEAEDFEGIGAENGQVGLQKINQQKPDLILCDVMMPELDGHGVLTALRSNPDTVSIPFIFLTAKGQMSDLREGMNLGADDYLIKPCTAEELVKVIQVRLAKQSALEKSVGTDSESLEKIENLLYYDRTTQLPNRLLLRDQFTAFLEKIAQTSPPKSSENQEETPLLVPILYIDLDKFSRLNESLNYEIGNEILQEMAKRLQNFMKNHGIIAHVNSDEFVLVFPPASGKNYITKVTKKLQETLAKPLVKNRQELLVTASIGIAIYPQDGDQIDTLLKNAKKAMEKAKERGGNTLSFYNPVFHIGNPHVLTLSAQLSKALERNELKLYYQPQIDLKTGQMVGAEALLRWYHPTRGLTGPNLFIPLAEETGLIESIGEWVIKMACQQMRKIHTSTQQFLNIAVNISPRQLEQPNLREIILEALISSQLESRFLELEVTETSLIQNAHATSRKLNTLKAMGLRLALDDFGIGYSSLSSLQQFPFDVLKIDQSFVKDIPLNPKNNAISESLIFLAHQMKLKVIAEGVETQECLQFLSQHQCDEVQGFFLAKPMPFEEFHQLVIHRKSWPKS